ncbi:MAG: hypothetical protein LBQ73_07260 [Tannerellaceae bacterium]|jgi:hypothetical protein|nr:hypothetical protein [Tannerellaceae bacterium]
MATTKTRKKVYSGRNTGMFYALIAQLDGYDSKYRDLIKEGVINDFLAKHYGEHHRRELRLSKLTDGEYRELISDLRNQVNEAKSVPKLQGEAVRRQLVHRILATLSKIGAVVINGDYSAVNYHIARLSLAKGRIIPRIPTDELPGLLAQARAYCDNVKKQQIKEMDLVAKN